MSWDWLLASLQIGRKVNNASYRLNLDGQVCNQVQTREAINGDYALNYTWQFIQDKCSAVGGVDK